MPIYDYQCRKCENTYDVFHKVREIEEDIICPACNSTRHVRLISAPSIFFSGNRKKERRDMPGDDDGWCGIRRRVRS